MKDGKAIIKDKFEMKTQIEYDEVNKVYHSKPVNLFVTYLLRLLYNFLNQLMESS